MPFTISHAAAVLPLSRPLARWHVLSAAIVGSMVPDFHVFLPWHLQRFETHSVAALFTFCLPVGVAVYWLFQLHIKTPLIALLPDGAYRRWQDDRPASFLSLKAWILAIVGVLFGALTHLTWDAFTHENARGVRMLPHPEEPILQMGHHYFLLPRLLQDISSIGGLAAVIFIIAYGLRPDRQEPLERPIGAVERRWWQLGALAFAMVCIALIALLGDEPYPWIRPGAIVYDGAIAFLRGLAIAVILLAIPARLRLLRSKRA